MDDWRLNGFLAASERGATKNTGRCCCCCCCSGQLDDEAERRGLTRLEARIGSGHERESHWPFVSRPEATRAPLSLRRSCRKISA